LVRPSKNDVNQRRRKNLSQKNPREKRGLLTAHKGMDSPHLNRNHLLVLALAVGAGLVGYYFWRSMYQPWYYPGSLHLMSIPAPVRLEPSEQNGFLQTNDGIKLYHFQVGTGPKPVLFVHGGPGHPISKLPKSFQDLLDSYTFHFYHQRGCGDSSRPIYDFANKGGRYYQENAKKLIGELGVEAHLADIERMRLLLFGKDGKIPLIGHSFGGFFAAMYACEFPERVESLILISPANVLVTSDGIFGEIKKRADPETKAEFEQFLTEYMNFGPAMFDKTDQDIRDQNNKLSEFIGKAFGWKLDVNPMMTGGFMTHAIYLGIGAERDYRSYLAKITAPTLVIHCKDDVVQTEKETNLYSSLIPGAISVTVPGGHFAVHEGGAQLTKELNQFLGRFTK
jgi:proline iminopeptidase